MIVYKNKRDNNIFINYVINLRKYITQQLLIENLLTY